MEENTHKGEEIEEPKKSAPYMHKGSKRFRKPRMSQDGKRIKILEMTAKEIPPTDIARAVCLPLDTVRDVIKRFSVVFKELENVNDYRNIKSDLLAAGQLAALKSAFSGTKLERASFISSLQGFEILNRAERLENGQSTDNVAHMLFGRIHITDGQ